MKIKIVPLLILTILSICSSIYAAQKFSINLTYPSFTGDLYASGVIYFPPGAVKSEENIAVKVATSGEEVSTFIKALEKWPDGSLLNVEVMFAINSSQRKEYLFVYGDGVKRKRRFSKTAVLPTVSFSIAGLPKMSEKMDVNVGEINVTVDKSPNIRYYAYAVPIVVIILLTYLRFLRTRRPYEN